MSVDLWRFSGRNFTRANSRSRLSRSALARLGEAVVETLEKRAYLSTTGQFSLVPAVTYTAKQNSLAVVTADLGNGEQDLVTVDNQGDISVLLGNGNGTFKPAMYFSDGLNCGPAFIAVADLGNENGPDLIVANAQGQVDVLQNEGDGDFSASEASSYQLTIGGISYANVDGDEELFTSGNDGTVTVFTYVEGAFRLGPTYSTAYSHGSGPLVAGDFFNNGYTDVAVANTQYNTVSILAGTDDGLALSTTDYKVGDEPNAITTADLDNSGTLDLVTADGDGTITVLPGNGQGAFQSPREINADSGALYGITTNDFNGDGNTDIAVSSYNHVTLLLGNGDLTFQAPLSYHVSYAANSVVSADFNGDGMPDLAASATSGYVSVLLNTNGSHNFNSPQTIAANGNGPDAVAVADLTDNDIADLVVANYNSNEVSVFLGNGDGTFQAPVTFPVSCGPTAILVGDFNNDGIPDIATLSASTGEVSVLIGNGNGTFKPAIYSYDGYSPVSDSPQALAEGDFNHDGKTDLVVAGGYDDQIIVLTGDGAGHFTANTDQSILGTCVDGCVTGDISSVAVGDLNADGFPDIVATDSYNNQVDVLLNNGSGGFPTFNSYATGYSPVAVAIGDLTNNGKQDIVTANSFGASVTVLLNNGDGTFGTPHSFPDFDGYYPTDIAISDINGDGNADIITTNSFNDAAPQSFVVRPNFRGEYVYGNKVNLLLGNGDGTFTQVGDITVGNDPTSLAVADVNGDAKPDIITTNYNDNTISIVLNNFPGNFKHTFGDPTYQPTGSEPYFVTSADLNGDGNQDLIVANYGAGTIQVMLGNGNGTFMPGQVYTVGTGPSEIIATDLTGDGDLDLVVANAGNDSISVLMGNGNGTFQPAVTTLLTGCGPQITLSPNAIAVGDVNNDGLPDIVIADGNGEVSVMLGNGDGTFTAPQTFQVNAATLPNTAAYGVALADLNGDGNLDIVVADTYSNVNYGRVEVLLGNGDGTFISATTYTTVGYDPTSLAVADLTGSGTLDVVVANHYSNNVSVLMGNGNGKFGSVNSFYAGAYVFDVAIADVLNNGTPDIVVTDASGSSDHDAYLLGNDNGSFGAPQFVLAGNDPRVVVVADFNNDDLPDFATANGDYNTVSVVLNETAGVPTVTENNGVVTVTGTAAKDQATISTYDGTLTITIDGQTQSFPSASITSLDINTGAGDDSVMLGAGVPPVIFDGGAGNDTIIDGSSSNNTLMGGAGNNSIVGGSGADSLIGGTGDDTVSGGGSGSFLEGNLANSGADNETLVGNAGNDTLISANGSDRLRGGSNVNYFLDTGSDDTVCGKGNMNFALENSTAQFLNITQFIDPSDTGALDGAPASEIGNQAVTAKIVGTDLVVGGTTGNDSIVISTRGADLVVVGDGSAPEQFPESGLTGIEAFGGAGNDTITIAHSILLPATITGGAGNDSLSGDGGNNILIGGAGNDTLVGGGGGTNLLVPGSYSQMQSISSGNDSLVGGAGYNIADFSLRSDNLFLSNDGLPDSGDSAQGEEVTIAKNIQAIWGGAGNNTIVGTTAGNFLSGGGGSGDSITGNAASDLIVGGSQGGNSVVVNKEPVTLDLKNGFADTYGGIQDPSIDIIDIDLGLDTTSSLL
jgi:Ca2+-binding RTX toxin-like protein